MSGRGVSSTEFAMYGVAGTDLVVRVLAEFLGFGRTIGLVVPTVVTWRLVLGLDTIGWVLGWAFLWFLLFLYGPIFFPPQGSRTTDWTLGLPNRLLVATAAVGVGITFESWLAIFESLANYGGIVTSPFYVSPLAALGLLGATLVGHFVVRAWEPSVWTVRHLPIPARPRERPIAPGRYLLAIVVLGAILAVVAMLFPLPELLVMGLGVGSIVAGVAPLTTPSVYLLALREDLTQGMLGGALAAWGELEDLFHLVYVLAPLLWFWLSAVATIHVFDLRAAVFRSPLSFLLLLGLLGAAGAHVTLFAFRLSLRIRARARREEQPPLVPLFLLPLGLALFALVAVVSSSGTTTPNSLSRVTFTGPLAAIALVGILLSVLTVLRPVVFPLIGRNTYDRATAAIATDVTLTFSLVASALYNPSAPEFDASLVVGLVVFALIVPSLWIGPEVFLPDDAVSDRDRLRIGIKRAGGVAVLGMLVGALALRPGLSETSIPVLLFGYGGSLLFLTGGLNLVLYLFAYPFRSKEPRGESPRL